MPLALQYRRLGAFIMKIAFASTYRLASRQRQLMDS